MSSIPATHVIQVTNVAPAATIEQMKELFGYLGRIRNIKLYPSENYIIEPQSRVCYVQYYEKWSVGVAQHLTNTVFIDRALIVVPIADEGIPSESTALALTNPSSALPGLVSSGPNALINEISSMDGSLVITTVDPKLVSLGLPQYPPLSANLDPVKIEEIRRTVTVGNLDISTSAENLLKFVNQIGEVKFLRMGGDGIQTPKIAYVEFTDQSSIPKALQYNGVAFEGRPLLITHSTNAIVKPLPKNSETAQKEIDEAMKRVKEAQSLIAAAIEPELPDKDKKKSRKSRSRSKSRRRSSSRSRHKRRSRSRSKRSRSKGRSSRVRRLSKSPPRHKHKSRSKSREKKKVVSPRHKREKTRSRSRDRRKGASSPHHKKEKSRSRSRERKKETSSHRHRKERSRSPVKSKKQKSKSRSPSVLSSKSRKSKRSEEKSDKNRERGKSPKVIKSEKNESAIENKFALSPVENSQSVELYGPLLPVPEVNSSTVDNSLSLVQKFDSDMSYSPASLNTESVEVSQSASKDIARKEHSFVKNLTDFKDDRNQILMKKYKIDNDNTELSDAISSCKNITNDSSEAIFSQQLSPTIDLYSNIDRNVSKSLHLDHQRESIPGLYEDISDLYGSSFPQSNNIPVISENSYSSSQSEDFIAKLNLDQRISNKSKNEACDISHLVGKNSIQPVVEAPQNISVISTLGLSSNKVEKGSTFFHAPYSSREKKKPTKSVIVSISNKHEASRSRSRSPITDNRTKSSRTRSRSLSKESSYSRKNKSRSVSKHRSRSRSRKRSRSRSKGSIRKTRSPSRNRHIRNRSRSHSSKRESYSPRRYSDPRRRMSSKRHSISSRRRSITPIRKSRVPRRRSPSPRRRSRSPRHRSRSHSYRRSQSPPISRTKNSSRSYRHSSRSPRRSQSPSDIRPGQKKNKRDSSKGRESKPMPISRIDSANMNCNVVRNYDEEDYNLEKMMEEKGNDKTEFIPTIVENSLSYGYNNMDMDLGSLQ